MLQATSLPIAYCLERAAECETKAERAKNAGIKPTTSERHETGCHWRGSRNTLNGLNSF
jgi:hypothetical protein